MLLCVLLWFVVPAVAAPEDSMLANIKEAKARLERTESKISKERVALANELRALEQQVMKLRNETTVARRKMDERTLSLSQLEKSPIELERATRVPTKFVEPFPASNRCRQSVIKRNELV